ncbi:MAG TPA: Fe-S cluster assembly protein SufD [Solirubrobacteraceae bacterium]|nr:Fe-S cluster assembly protein SufD [Solirubrobacteraceae bacterium]
MDAYPDAPGGAEDAAEHVLDLDLDAAVRVSADEAVSEGPVVLPLAVAAARHPDIVERHLGSLVTPDTPLVARNEAGWTDGAFVYVPRGVHVEAPIVLTTVHEQPGTTLHNRALIVLEEGAQAEVWHQSLSSGAEADGVVNGVVELVVGQAARLRFVDAQALSERTWVFGAERAEVARDGSLDWITLGFGSTNGKVFLTTRLAGPGATATVTGAYATRERQHLDFDTLQEHAAPDTTSDLAFRGILGGRSSAVWRGMIQVDEGAQRTDAFQESRNLLLSKRAHADAIPGLEILANDVRCTHAAAIAQVDPEQLFYLGSHGLPESDAKRLVVEGFLEALVDRFEEGPVRDAVAGAIERRLATVLG